MQLEQHASRWHDSRATQAAAVVLIFAALAAILSYFYASQLQEFWRGLTRVRPYLRTQVAPYVLTHEAERSLKPLSSFRECAANCREMIVLPAGEFMMGSPANERGRYSNEGPPHKVVLAHPFAVSRFEATFDDWDACAAHGDCDPRISDMGSGREKRPVMNIDWNDARSYAAWLSRVTGKSYRLLSEAEWEYAARAGTVTRYSWGRRSAAEMPIAQTAAASGMARRPRRSAHSLPTGSAFTICTAISGSGRMLSEQLRRSARRWLAKDGRRMQ
jgi:formylglycine-generating enzyme required for sulfatase activity